MDYKELFLAAFKKSNPNLNLEENFPLYDVLVLPASDMLDEIDSSLTALEEKVDITKYFDEDGYIKSEEYYTILKNNYSLPEQFSDKASVLVYLLSETAVSYVSININVAITREGKTFIIPASDYSNISWQSRDDLFAFPVIAVAQFTGTEYTEVTPGYWETDNIIEGIVSYVTDAYPTGGGDVTQTLTYDRVLSMLNNKGWDNVPAVVQHLYDDILSEEPGKLSIVKLTDNDLESGIIPVADAFLQTGNSADIRLHFTQTTVSEIVEGVYLSGYFEYSFPEHIPVYAVLTVVDFLGNDVTYKMDYFAKKLYFATPKVRVSYITTDQDQMDYIRSTMAAYAFNHVGATYVLKSFYPVSIYVDADCFQDPSTATDAMVTSVNEVLSAYVLPTETFASITYKALFNEVFEQTGYYLVTFKVRLGGRTNLPDEASYIVEMSSANALIPNAVTFVKNNVTYSLSDTNSIMLGGRI